MTTNSQRLAKRYEFPSFTHLAGDLVHGLGQPLHVAGGDTGDGYSAVLCGVYGMLQTVSVRQKRSGDTISPPLPTGPSARLLILCMQTFRSET